MPTKLSVSELLDLSTACATTAAAGEALLDNGGIDAGDLADIPKVFAAVRAWTDVSPTEVLPQVADMDDAGAETVAAHFRVVFNITNDNVEQVIESGYGVILHVVAAINHWRLAGEGIKALRAAA